MADDDVESFSTGKSCGDQESEANEPATHNVKGPLTPTLSPLDGERENHAEPFGVACRKLFHWASYTFVRKEKRQDCAGDAPFAGRKSLSMLGSFCTVGVLAGEMAEWFKAHAWKA